MSMELRSKLARCALAVVALALVLPGFQVARACIKAEDAGPGCSGCQPTACSLCMSGDCPGTRVQCIHNITVKFVEKGAWGLVSVIYNCWCEFECVPMRAGEECNDATNGCVGTGAVVSVSQTTFRSGVTDGGDCTDIH